MEKLYYHIGQLEGYVFEEKEFWPLISPRTFDNERRKEIEEKIDLYRIQNTSCIFSRYTSLFVCPTEEEAIAWAQRKIGHGNKCYLYTLAYSGKVSWHIADYYDRFAELLKGENYILRNVQTLEQAAELYWKEVEPTDNRYYYDGLIESKPYILKREKVLIP